MGVVAHHRAHDLGPVAVVLGAVGGVDLALGGVVGPGEGYAGKGGCQRIVPTANPFFVAVGNYLCDRRPKAFATDRVAGQGSGAPGVLSSVGRKM